MSRNIHTTGVSYKYWYPDEDSTQYLYETYPDVSTVVRSSRIQTPMQQ